MLGLGREPFAWHASCEGALVFVGGPSLKEAQALLASALLCRPPPPPALHCSVVLVWSSKGSQEHLRR